MKVPFYRVEIRTEEIREVVDTLKSGWIGTGRKTQLFEEEFKKFTGARFAIALNSCTSGLHLSLLAYEIGEGDEVITTPLTFPSTANVIEHVKAKPIFVDVERNTGNISPEKIEDAITPRTRAIIPVHLYGLPCDMTFIMKIAERYSIKVIEDAAHALGAVYKGKKIGGIGHTTSFSFYVTKNITTGCGGMLTTDDERVMDFVIKARFHGLTSDAYAREGKTSPEHYEVLFPGLEYNMTDLHASIGIWQLRKFEESQKRRKEIWNRYKNAFSEIEEIEMLSDIPEKNSVHAHHLFTILIKTELLRINREELRTILYRKGIGTGIHFTSLHLNKFYREKYHYRKGDFPNAEYISERTLSLPFFPDMREEEVEYVIQVLKNIIKENTK